MKRQPQSPEVNDSEFRKSDCGWRLGIAGKLGWSGLMITVGRVIFLLAIDGAWIDALLFGTIFSAFFYAAVESVASRQFVSKQIVYHREREPIRYWFWVALMFGASVVLFAGLWGAIPL